MSAFAYLQSASQSGNVALAFPSVNVAGNMIVVATSNTSVTAVNDTQGNLYNIASNAYFGSSQIQMWVALNIKAGANSVTATGLAGSGANSSIAIIEYTAPTSFQLISTSSKLLYETASQSPSETLLIIASYDYHSSHSWTGTNLTIRETTTEGGGQTLGIGDFYTATSTITTSSAINGCSDSGGCPTATLSNIQMGGGGSSTSDIQISVSDPLVVN